VDILMTRASYRVLPVEPLTAEAFRPFGDVIEARTGGPHFPINGGRAERFHDLASVDTSEGRGRPVISVVRSQASSLPLELMLLERHLRGSQAFVPLSQAAFLVVVAPAGDAPAPEQVRCFLPAPGQGVNYARGTWHHPLIALSDGADFLVVDRAGPDGEIDCEETLLLGETLVVDNIRA
jgi:ureidoglycolate lyase